MSALGRVQPDIIILRMTSFNQYSQFEYIGPYRIPTSHFCKFKSEQVHAIHVCACRTRP